MSTQPQRRHITWNPGPSQGGGGTAGIRDGKSWWRDGDRLLIIVNTVEDHSMSLVRVSADGPESLSFINPDTGDEDFDYSAEDIDWWAHVPMPEQD